MRVLQCRIQMMFTTFFILPSFNLFIILSARVLFFHNYSPFTFSSTVICFQHKNNKYNRVIWIYDFEWKEENQIIYYYYWNWSTFCIVCKWKIIFEGEIIYQSISVWLNYSEVKQHFSAQSYQKYIKMKLIYESIFMLLTIRVVLGKFYFQKSNPSIPGNGLIFYDMKSNSTLLPPIIERATLTGNKIILRQDNMGLPCNCFEMTCSCCAGLNIQQFNINQNSK